MLLHALAIWAGFLLAAMIYFNGLMAQELNSITASFSVHLVGSVAALLLMLLWKNPSNGSPSPVPRWALFSGVFGGLVVVIVGITVNSPLGVSGTVALFLLGQILLGWVFDHWGLLGLARRKITLADLLQATLVLLGAGVLVYG